MIKVSQTGNASDFVLITTAGEALSARDACYINSADGKAYKCDADDVTKSKFVGFAQEAAALNAAVNIVNHGQMTGFSGLTIGARYYVSATAGAITATSPVNSIHVGIALSATVIQIDPITRVTTQTFNASGTWTKPANLTRIRVQVWGGGGSGGSGVSSTSEVSGGGGGGYSEKWIESALLSATETVTIGDGGTAVSGGNQDGVAGGNSTFGTLVTGYGGGAGTSDSTAAGGGGGGGPFGAGGNGSNATAGSAGAPGSPVAGIGGTGSDNNHGLYGAGGGGCAAGAAAQAGGNAYYGGGGGGGSSSLGTGAGGTSFHGGAGGAGDYSASGNATAGSVPGGGGGGKNSNVGSGNSGAGGKGRIIITEYYI